MNGEKLLEILGQSLGLVGHQMDQLQGGTDDGPDCNRAELKHKYKDSFRKGSAPAAYSLEGIRSHKGGP